MMEKTVIHIPSGVKIMTTTVQNNQKADTAICEKAPLTQVLNHIEMEMQQQQQQEAGQPELAGRSLVSHVPVSIGTKSHDSSSTLCSLSSKEGSENGDCMSTTTSSTPFRPSSATSGKPAIVSTGSDSQEPAETEKIRATLNLKVSSSTKSSVSFAGDAMNVSPDSSSTSLPSSITTTRPAKKARTISNDATNNATSFTTDPDASASSPKAASPQKQHCSPLLLAQDEDEEHLSPLHVFVRKQIEVFTATPTELAQPAPGRKQPIQLHQVGLRCIHCRNLPSIGSRKSRVKRAVCYPSAIGRIYHSVSDMKFDHFSHCKSIPSEVRKTFETLKAEGKSAQKEKQSKSGNGKSNKGNSSSSTSKYYRDSASRMGLVDGPGGIIYMGTEHSRTTTQHQTSNDQDAVSTPVTTTPNVPPQQMTQNILQQQQEQEYRNFLIQQQNLATVNTAAVASMLFPPIPMSTILPVNTGTENLGLGINHLTTAMNSSLLQSLLMNAVAAGAHAQKSIDALARAKQQQKSSVQFSQPNPLKRPLESSPPTLGEKIVLPLAALEDASDLNPLHCFVRKHVELFSADKNDTEAPCPGRKTRVTLGQVGIRCKHCAKLKLKPRERVKRAVCYPPSIDGIYHSVSNMKFDHFGICPNLPPEAKKELAQLKASYSGRNIGSTNTAKYYRESAVAKGLVDTDKGIRFRETCTPVMVTATAGNPAVPLCPSMAPGVSVPPPPLAGADITQIPTGISALMMAAATHATSI